MGGRNGRVKQNPGVIRKTAKLGPRPLAKEVGKRLLYQRGRPSGGGGCYND
jgi:hypothetical protein